MIEMRKKPRFLTPTAGCAVFVLSAFLCGCSSEKADKEAPWPALVDGKYLRKAFRFKPRTVVYERLDTRIAAVLVVFYLDAEPDKEKRPADVFPVTWAGREASVRREVEKLMAMDNGHITVDAHWVNQPSPIRHAYSGQRVLLGDLRRDIKKNKE